MLLEEIFINNSKLLLDKQLFRMSSPLKADGYLYVEITDNGPGICEEDLPYVFDPFFSNKKKGTGLGLSNAKKVFEAHGGTVSIVAREQKGTQCLLVIPVRQTK